MKKVYLIALVVLAIVIIGVAYAEQITLTAYYPAPSGVYRKFVTTSETNLATNPSGSDLNARVCIGRTAAGTYDTEAVNLDVGANVGEGYTAVDDLYLKNPKSGSARWASQSTAASATSFDLVTFSGGGTQGSVPNLPAGNYFFTVFGHTTGATLGFTIQTTAEGQTSSIYVYPGMASGPGFAVPFSMSGIVTVIDGTMDISSSNCLMSRISGFRL